MRKKDFSYKPSIYSIRQFIASILLGFLSLLPGCNSNDSSGQLVTSSGSGSTLEQRAIGNLLELYRTAMVQEDIDRIQDLLAVDSLAVAVPNDAFVEAGRFREALTMTFRKQRIMALRIMDANISPDRRQVTLTEIESSLDQKTLEQSTRQFRTTWRLRADLDPDPQRRVTTFRITAVHRDGPLVQVITPGQILAQALARIEVHTPQIDAAQVEFLVPETLEGQSLTADGNRWRGTFLAPPGPQPLPLRVIIRSPNGQSTTLEHPYSLRLPGEGVVERISGTGKTRFFAVTVAPDGTVWAGGTSGGSLYRVSPEGTMAARVGQLFEQAEGRVTDLTFDTLGRLHALAFSPQASGDYLLLAPNTSTNFCQTVNILDPLYPFQAFLRPHEPLAQSPSTRTVASQDGAVWLFGSEGGVAQVDDDFRQEPCPAVNVRYQPFFSRANSGILSNAVQAFVPARDGAFWFGTALGLVRLQEEQFTPVLFERNLAISGNVATLETFFEEIAQAIFEARPLTAVTLGNVSFVQEFGAPLSKEDLIFSALEDTQEHLWVGTLGGGLRRIDVLQNMPMQKRHLTRTDGLLSNIIFALALAPDGTIWVATDEGVSHLRDTGDTVTIRNFSVLDGLALPVRDLVIDAAGTVWMATDGGLFRLHTDVGEVSGVVQDEAGQPVQGATVTVLGTTLRALTDAAGRFVLRNVPRRRQFIGVTAADATKSPFSAVFREIDVSSATQLTVVLKPVVSFDPLAGGQITFPYDPEAFLSILPGVIQLPEGIAPALHLTVLPLTALLHSLPEDFQAGAAARLAPDNITFALPVQLTLPNQGRLPAGQAVNLFRLDETRLTYEEIGSGRVSDDGRVITTVSSNLRRLSTVVFATSSQSTPATLRLLPVAGNNQSLASGETLLQPFVMRMEDQFGNGVAGVEIVARIIRGDGTLLPPVSTNPRETLQVTNARGEVSFQLQAGETDTTDIVVQVVAPTLPEVAPIQFLTIVGMVDIADLPFDLTVAGETVYVAARFSGLQVIDVREPSRSEILRMIPLAGTTFNTTVAEDILYVATFAPTALYTFDRREPQPLLGCLQSVQGVEIDNCDAREQFPEQLTPVRLVAQPPWLYIAFADRRTGTGALYIIDVTAPARPRVVGSVTLPGRPNGLIVVDGFAYLPAGFAGLLVVDVRQPSRPLPAPASSLPELAAFSGITGAGQTAYLVEKTANGLQLRALDLSTPGTVVLAGTAPLPVAALPFTSATLAVAGDYAYVASFDLGLQVFDVRSKDHLRFVGRVDTPSVAFNTAVVQGPVGTRIYITDLAVGLSIVAGPPLAPADTDGDGVIDFFDAFAENSDETLDTDRDSIGNNADLDDDHDGFPDAEEQQRGTDPLNARDFPVSFPLLDAASTLVVDASAPDQLGNGSTAAPYRSISAALKAIAILRDRGFTAPLTVSIQPGIYSALQTMESFPLLLNSDGVREGVTLQGPPEATQTIVDAAFFADVLDSLTGGIAVKGLTLQRGINGSVTNSATPPGISFRNMRVLNNLFHGIVVGDGVPVSIAESEIADNGSRGIEIFNGSAALIHGNMIHDNKDDGVFIGQASATLSQNTIQGNRRAGIVVSSTSTATNITGNVILENTAGGVVIELDSVATLLENVIRENGNETTSHGIQVDLGAAASIMDNDVYGHSGAGILVLDSDTMGTLVANRVYNNAIGIGIFFAATAVLQRNQASNNLQDGVQLSRDAVGEFSANVMEHNGRDGVRLQNASFATFNGDTMAQNTAHGLALFGASRAEVGLQEGVVTLSRNGGFGIFVDADHSEVQINRDRVVFDRNSAGETSVLGLLP